ncbi:DNA repair protein RecO [Salinicoccus sp. Marseille-QA3877]
MIYQQKGIMIRQTNYSESSRIITILNEDGVMVPLMARGFNKTKSPFIVLRQGFKEALFTYNRFKGMGTLNEVDVISHFKGINNDFDLFAYGSYIMEFVTRILTDEDVTPKNFELLMKCFRLLEKKEENEKNAVTALAAIKLMPQYGIEINVDECALCGSRDYNTFSHYSFMYHSVICDHCANEDTLERAVNIGNRSIYLAAYMKNVKLDLINSVKTSPENGRALLNFIEMLYDEYAGVYFKARKLVKDIQD